MFESRISLLIQCRIIALKVSAMYYFRWKFQIIHFVSQPFRGLTPSTDCAAGTYHIAYNYNFFIYLYYPIITDMKAEIFKSPGFLLTLLLCMKTRRSVMKNKFGKRLFRYYLMRMSQNLIFSKNLISLKSFFFQCSR